MTFGAQLVHWRNKIAIIKTYWALLIVFLNLWRPRYHASNFVLAIKWCVVITCARVYVCTYISKVMYLEYGRPLEVVGWCYMQGCICVNTWIGICAHTVVCMREDCRDRNTPESARTPELAGGGVKESEVEHCESELHSIEYFYVCDVVFVEMHKCLFLWGTEHHNFRSCFRHYLGKIIHIAFKVYWLCIYIISFSA